MAREAEIAIVREWLTTEVARYQRHPTTPAPAEALINALSHHRASAVGDGEVERFFLDQDDSSHWYIVPADRRAEWEEWANIPEDDEVGWTEPGFVRRLDGGPNRVTFSAPIDGDTSVAMPPRDGRALELARKIVLHLTLRVNMDVLNPEQSWAARDVACELVALLEGKA